MCDQKALKFVNNFESFTYRDGSIASTFYFKDGIHLNNTGTVRLLSNINKLIRLFKGTVGIVQQHGYRPFKHNASFTYRPDKHRRRKQNDKRYFYSRHQNNENNYEVSRDYTYEHLYKSPNSRNRAYSQSTPNSRYRGYSQSTPNPRYRGYSQSTYRNSPYNQIARDDLYGHPFGK